MHGRPGTYSIVAVDTVTGEVGVAVQSKYFCVGAVVPWARAGVGAVATQAAGVAAYGPRILELLANGLEPADAIERALADDGARATRQLGVVAASGRARATPAPSATSGRATSRATASRCRGTSSPARAWLRRWRARTARPRARSPTV